MNLRDTGSREIRACQRIDVGQPVARARSGKGTAGVGMERDESIPYLVANLERLWPDRGTEPCNNLPGRLPEAVDNLFEQSALRNEMKISAVETPREAMMTLAEYPLEVQVRQLSESLNKTAGESENGDFSGLLLSWAMGDIDRNARLIAASMSPLTYRNVVVDRNRKWLPRLEGYLAKPQQTMVVVGNAHLVGKGNLIDMLKHRGHTVSRIQ